MIKKLYDGTRNTGLTVRPDPQWPGMWRLHYPEGGTSDMVNLSRATDAGLAWLARTNMRSSASEARWVNRE